MMAIEVCNLSKKFKPQNNGLDIFKRCPDVFALKDINLQIKKGEVFCLLGPNGAGKTTLIKII
jgi:ABC-type multidrug transport system ATPase subunit